MLKNRFDNYAETIEVRSAGIRLLQLPLKTSKCAPVEYASSHCKGNSLYTVAAEALEVRSAGIRLFPLYRE